MRCAVPRGGGASCSNVGSNDGTDEENLSSQTNMCFQGSQCSTTGSNAGNQVTIAFNGAVCDNTGSTKDMF